MNWEKLISAKRLGMEDFVMLDSGSNSIYLAIKLLELPPGSEIILPTFTWISCATAIILNDCKPVFADIDLETQNITRETIEPVITEKTAAIMVVHYAGKPVKMTVAGKVVYVKALTRKERNELLRKADAIREGEIGAVEPLFDEVTSLVVEIEGIPKDQTATWLDVQGMRLMSDLVGAILAGSSLSEDQVKNLRSSLKSSDSTPTELSEATSSAE